MLRVILAAAIAAAAFAAPALAQPALQSWDAPDGRFSISKPARWPVDSMETTPDGIVRFVTGTADEECWFTVIPREGTAGLAGTRLATGFAAPVASDKWLEIARTQRLFRGVEPTLTTSGVDTAKPWPVQTATFAHPKNGAVVGAIHARPGLEVYAFCGSYAPGDRAALFAAVAGSFATPKDAEMLIPPAPVEAAPAAEAPPAEEPKPSRRRRN